MTCIIGVFTLSVEFPKKYPLSQPQIRFLTPVCQHCKNYMTKKSIDISL